MRNFILPVVIIGVIALILVIVIFMQKRWERNIQEEAELYKQAEWTGDCPVSNPETGASCQRQEFHEEHHYRVHNGKMHTW